MDDNSSDSGPEIVSAYSQSNYNVHLLRNPGNGIVDALSAGLEAAKGEYISRMDGDDVMPKGKLANLFKVLQEGADVATGQLKYFATGKELGKGYERYTDWLNGLIDSCDFYSQIYRECTIASPNWMMHRATLDSIGGFGSRYPEDYDLVFRMKQAKLNVQGTKELTHLWRDHDSRASRNDPNYLDNSFLKLKCEHFLSQNLKDNRPLVLIGAGKKGKTIAQFLGENLSEWITNNPRKQGHIISKLMLSSFEEHEFSPSNQYISSLASPKDRKEIVSIFSFFAFKEGQDYFLFC